MMVLITYDVDTVSDSGKKRLRNVANACKDYGQRVQNSVFECMLTESQFLLLKARLKSIIDLNLDSIRFYFLGKNWSKRIEYLGEITSFDLSGELII